MELMEKITDLIFRISESDFNLVGELYPQFKEYIIEALYKHTDEFVNSLLSLLNQRDLKTDFVINEILKCIIYLPKPLGNMTIKFRPVLIAALTHPNAEVRDNAVALIEHWGDSYYKPILRQCASKEVLDWLARYMIKVSFDLDNIGAVK